jgi:hypothetical protein
MNSTLDEISKLQEVKIPFPPPRPFFQLSHCLQHLFPSPRGGKPVAAPVGNVTKKRVRDEELFMRSVISDSDKGLIRPIYPPSAARGPPGINPAVLLKMGPPMLVGSPPHSTSTSEVDQSSSSPVESNEQDASSGQKTAAAAATLEADAGGVGSETYPQYPVGATDDGIKYAKMPPALRPERPKKIEKPKTKPLTPQQAAAQPQPSHAMVTLEILTSEITLAPSIDQETRPHSKASWS